MGIVCCKKSNDPLVPAIISIAPASGIIGSTVTITGSNFGSKKSDIVVKFNGTESVISSFSETSLTVNVPAGGTSGAISITAPGGTVQGPAFMYTVDVYVAGYEFVQYKYVNTAKYWKNGIATTLSDGSKDALAYSIFVSGSDIYVTGSEFGTNCYLAKYWKNGQVVTLSDGTTPAAVFSVFVLGNDLYLAGSMGYNPIYWKNGVPVSPQRYSAGGACYSIFLDGTDLYVAGRSAMDAAYWKNGAFVKLSKDLPAAANRIFVQDKDVYVAGYEMNTGGVNIAKYWKNGNEVLLSKSNSDAMATDLIVSGTDVYVAGWEGNVAKYWKNGTEIALTDGKLKARTNSIAVVGSDVYVAGYQSDEIRNIAKYWKNGQEVKLSDGPKDANAECIFIVK